MKIFISEGPNAGQELDLEGTGVIGRDPDAASIVLDDPEASRRHVSISAEGSKLVVEDMGSTNGTFVNGERIQGSRTVEAGDKLRIGTTVLELRSDVAATRISSIPEPVDYDTTAVGERIPAPVAGGSPETPPEPGGPPPPPPPPGEGAGAPPTPPPPPAAAPPPEPGYAPPPEAGGPDYAQPGGAIAQPGLPAQGPMQVRDSTVEWLLCLFVIPYIPIYAIIWFHRANKEMQAWSGGRIEYNAGASLAALLLGWVLLFIPTIVAYVSFCGRVRTAQRMAGLPETAGFWAVFWRMILLSYGFKWLQDRFNEIAIRQPQA